MLAGNDGGVYLTENARDPRVAVLERIGELGSGASAPRLQPYLADYDTTVATAVAKTLAGSFPVNDFLSGTDKLKILSAEA